MGGNPNFTLTSLHCRCSPCPPPVFTARAFGRQVVEALRGPSGQGPGRGGNRPVIAQSSLAATIGNVATVIADWIPTTHRMVPSSARRLAMSAFVASCSRPAPTAVLAGVLPDHTLVLVMRTDPHPDEVAAILDGKGSVGKADSSRPELADLLEVQRWMSRILLEQSEVFPGQILGAFGEIGEARPKLTCRPVHLQLPKSSSLLLARGFFDQEVQLAGCSVFLDFPVPAFPRSFGEPLLQAHIFLRRKRDDRRLYFFYRRHHEHLLIPAAGHRASYSGFGFAPSGCRFVGRP